MLAASKEMGNKHFWADSRFLTRLPRHAAWLYNRRAAGEVADPTPYEKTRVLKYQTPIAPVGDAVACRRPGAKVDKLEFSWVEGIWSGRDARVD